MYLQITTRCNMHCLHCCFSCGKHGKHADFPLVKEAIYYAKEIDDEFITIGGGEPTLHPKFFDILELCLEQFPSVWMATNGSRTKVMKRLYKILIQEDYPDDLDFSSENADEILKNYRPIYQTNQLTVALSTDYYHEPIDPEILSLWESMTKNYCNGFELRDVTKTRDGVAAMGRAILTEVGEGNHCVCPDLFVRTDGKIKLCGCTGAPIIGTVSMGIRDEWLEYIQHNPSYQETRCYRGG
jgi:organic radical activating enzyme